LHLLRLKDDRIDLQMELLSNDRGGDFSAYIEQFEGENL